MYTSENRNCENCGNSLGMNNNYCSICGFTISHDDYGPMNDKSYEYNTPTENYTGNVQQPQNRDHRTQDNYQSQYSQRPQQQQMSQQSYQPPRQNIYQSYNREESINTVALVGFVLGCVGAFVFLINMFSFYGIMIGIAGFVVSLIGLSQINKTGEKGKGFAIAGIAIGAVAIIFFIMYVLAYVFAWLSVLSWIGRFFWWLFS